MKRMMFKIGYGLAVIDREIEFLVDRLHGAAFSKEKRMLQRHQDREDYEYLVNPALSIR